jgi:hypothetical protein
MKKAPKLWRRKKGGKHVGNWFVTIKDIPVNLGTKDADRALRHRSEALKGRRKFVDDVEGAADDTVAVVAPKPSPIETVLPEPPPAAAPPNPLPAAAPAPDPVAAPGPAKQEDWAAAAAAAAEEADADDDDGDAPPGEAAAAKREFVVTIEDAMRILKMPASELAPAAVELQLKGHEILAGWVFGYELAPVPADHMGRGVLAAGYEPVIRALQLEDLKIHPGWFILAGSAMILSAQLRGAKKKPVEPKADLRVVP